MPTVMSQILGDSHPESLWLERRVWVTAGFLLAAPLAFSRTLGALKCAPLKNTNKQKSMKLLFVFFGGARKICASFLLFFRFRIFKEKFPLNFFFVCVFVCIFI